MFRDRADAGKQLAERLSKLDLDDPVVLGMARGGVSVGAEIARSLGAPLDVIVVRKLGHPSQPELGLGAIAEGDVRVMNTDLLNQLGLSQGSLDEVARREESELQRRLAAYRGDRPAVEVSGRTVIVADDGLATGFTALAAVRSLRKRGARRVVLAVPVAPPGAASMLESEADLVVCLVVTERFFGLSEWYLDFRQVSDEEVVRLLATFRPGPHPDEEDREAGGDQRNGGRPPTAAREPGTGGKAQSEEVEIPAGELTLQGDLVVPSGAIGLVLFAHGSGSSRLSARNRAVADTLHGAHLATLLFDLLTEDEAIQRASVFDIALLASRMHDATHWTRGVELVARMPIGYFGASTGAAAALLAASRLDGAVGAVVSRGGRPDLAGDRVLASVTAPTLLIVGSRDETVLELNRRALNALRSQRRLEVVEGATHLFEEPGALEQVAHLAAAWFASHLAAPQPAT